MSLIGIWQDFKIMKRNLDMKSLDIKNLDFKSQEHQIPDFRSQDFKNLELLPQYLKTTQTKQ